MGVLTALVMTTAGLAGLAGADSRDDAQGPVPPADAWRHAAAAGETLTLRAHGETLTLRVHENTEVRPDGFVAKNARGHVVDTSDVLLLAGEVVGEPGSWVRVTVTGDGVMGHVQSARAGFLTLAPRADGTTVALTEIDVRALQGSGDHAIEPDEVENRAQDCSSLWWTPRVANPSGMVLGWPSRDFDVAFAVDGTFASRHGSAWASVALSYVNSLDGLFRAQFDVRVLAVHLVVVPDAALTGTTTSSWLDALQDYYNANYPTLPRDNVNLFAGRGATNAAGQVNCVGSAGRTSVSYSVGETEGGDYNWFGLSLLPDKAVKVAAHELAHTLSAHHHYANCAEASLVYSPFRPLDMCTVMINDWGLIAPTFSTASKLTVRGWADHYDI